MNFNPDTRAKLQIAVNNYKMFGAWKTIKDVTAYLLANGATDDFDRRYGVTTSGSVEARDAGITDENVLTNAIRYVPIPEPVMRHILRTVTKELNPGEFSFVDLGCGWGRAVLIASWFPFKEIIGVEVSPAHCEIANRNIGQYLESRAGDRATKCRSIRVSHANALDFEFPDSNLLIYMFRPFSGSLFRGVLDKLHQFRVKTGRQVLVVLCCPTEERLLEEHPAFVRRSEHQVVSPEYSWNLWACDAR
ncbi:SAM-dependent methyltransferase [Sorangium sp. So ce204]|uniref:SAM-dependent methyltransferase n=1 Tax=Sorangium sp. So ce204 TaxID=3133288 RepID=UPI003F5E6D14